MPKKNALLSQNSDTAARNPSESQIAIRLADEFIHNLSEITSPKVLAEIRRVLNLLTITPELGSAHVRESLTCLFGPNLRKISVSTFVIVYRYENKVIDVLACVPGRKIF